MILNQDLVRLDCFNGSYFTRWQDKVSFLLNYDNQDLLHPRSYLGTITITKEK